MAKSKSGPIIEGLTPMCPLTGVESIDPATGYPVAIRPHFMFAKICNGGNSIFMRCTIHNIQSFCSDQGIIRRYWNAANAKKESASSGGQPRGR